MKEKKYPPAPMPRRKELNDTPIKLCNEISRLFRAHMRETESDSGVMSQQGAHLVMSTLAINDGINQLELVKKTHLRPPTVSVILKRMESEGLVERKSNPDDKRSVSVYLTEKGRELDKTNIRRVKAVDAVALSGMGDEEIAVLMTLLPKIRDNLLPERQSERGDDLK